MVDFEEYFRIQKSNIQKTEEILVKMRTLEGTLKLRVRLGSVLPAVSPDRLETIISQLWVKLVKLLADVFALWKVRLKILNFRKKLTRIRIRLRLNMVMVRIEQ